MTAETDIATYLASQGFGTLGSTIFVNDRPASPDALISVFGYAGQAPERTHDTSGNAKPGVQVWVRGAVDGAGTARAQIREHLCRSRRHNEYHHQRDVLRWHQRHPVRGNPDGKRRGQPSRIRVELHLYREAVNAGPESTAQENAAAGKKPHFTTHKPRKRRT